nr:hypothetical protein [Tanacetum cinerariifolium]
TNKKQEFVKSNDKKEDKKADEKKRDMSKIKCYNCKKEGHFAKDCKKAQVKDYNYCKSKMLLAKKDSDEQVLLAKDQAWMESKSNAITARRNDILPKTARKQMSKIMSITRQRCCLQRKTKMNKFFLAEDQAWMESSSDSDQEINANMVFMAQIEKVLSDSEASSSSADEKISEVSYYLSESESESEFETSEYYDNSTNYGLFVNNDDDQEIFHDAIESASENC